jgi:altronate dehydratase small subunit
VSKPSVPHSTPPRDALLLTPADDVATALRPLHAGQQASVQGLQGTLLIRQDIPFCHKVACRDIAAGDRVRKYGEVIGMASTAIRAGDHVHVHNIRSVRI